MSEVMSASFAESVLLIAVPFVPLVMSAAMLPARWRESVVRLAPWASLPALLVAAFSTGEMLDLPWLLLGSRFGMDDVGQVFLVFTAVLWLLAGIYGRSYLAGDTRRARFFAFYLLTMSGNLGLIVSQDILSFYLFFALMSFSSYVLIMHKQIPQALRAGRIYIYFVVLGEVLLFAGAVMGAWQAGTLYLDEFPGTAQSNIVTGLLIVGFGIKAGALPVHAWLPLAHSVAPTPASVVLSGAMIQSGLLGWLRFLPLGHVALPEWSLVCITAGFGAAIYGVLVGLSQDEPKAVLAYSSISQMGLITVGTGVGMAAPEIWPLCLSAILVYAFHHAFAKGALFLGVGIAASTGGAMTRRGPIVAGLLLPAFALAGLPFTSGAVAKSGLTELIGHLPEPWSVRMATLLSLVAVGTTCLMARLFYLVWFQESGHPQKTNGLWPPWLAMLSVVAFSIWLWPSVDTATLLTTSFAGLWHALWPAAAGATGAWVAWTLACKGLLKFPYRIPVGDILVPVSWLSRKLGRSWSCMTDRFRQRAKDRAWNLQQAFSGLARFRSPWQLEVRMRRWEIWGVMFVTLLVLFYVMLALA